MSKISLEPNASGAGTFTLAAPNSNTNRTLNLPDESGVLFSDGTGVPGAAVTGQLASSNMPAGSVIQVVSTTKTDTFSLNLPSGESADIPGLSVNITPISTQSKILTLLTVCGHNGVEAGIHCNVKRNGTTLAVPDTSSSFDPVLAGTFGGTDNRFVSSSTGIIIDTPSTTSSVTYKAVVVSIAASSRTHFINRPASLGRNLSVSTITVMEIAG